MTPASKIWTWWLIGLGWFFFLLWPLTGIKGGTIGWGVSREIFGVVAAISFIGVAFAQARGKGLLAGPEKAFSGVSAAISGTVSALPKWLVFAVLAAAAIAFPHFTDRYAHDVAINVLIYVCLGLGLNVVVGLCGLLDLGYIAFYGVGAYAYALLSVHFGFPFWPALPIAAVLASLAGSIVGYPTLRMRGDYLAIVTLGFGEIIRIVMNNWMTLTNGPNGILGVKPPAMWLPAFTDSGFVFELFTFKRLMPMYYLALVLAVLTVIGVYRLNHSRVGRAWEAIREDETAAELMGVNTFNYKLLAYAMGAAFAGLAGAYFAARMKSVSPSSFTFNESAMVLAMVVLGGMGSIPGIILGAAALIVLPELFREFELYRMLAFGGAMTIMMLFRPKGLWPASRVGVRSEEKH